MKKTVWSEISRRSFLKTSGAMVGALAGGSLVGGASSLPGASGDPQSRTPIFPKYKPDVALVFSRYDG